MALTADRYLECWGGGAQRGAGPRVGGPGGRTKRRSGHQPEAGRPPGLQPRDDPAVCGGAAGEAPGGIVAARLPLPGFLPIVDRDSGLAARVRERTVRSGAEQLLWVQRAGSGVGLALTPSVPEITRCAGTRFLLSFLSTHFPHAPSQPRCLRRTR